MPGGDRTGPMGMGAMTGRAAGYCAGYNAPGYMNPGGGRFFGRGGGRGGGRGYRNRFYATGIPGIGRGGGRGPYPYGGQYYPAPYAATAGPAPNPGDEMEFLKEQAEAIQGELKAINERIEQLNKDSKNTK